MIAFPRKPATGEVEVSFSYSYVLTAKGVAFYAEKTLRELQDEIDKELSQ